jgi:hypothetical protein
MVKGVHGDAGLDQRGGNVGLQVRKCQDQVRAQGQYLFEIGRCEGGNPRLLAAHLRRSHGVTRYSDDACILTKKVKRLDRLLGQADDPSRRKFFHIPILRQKRTRVSELKVQRGKLKFLL